MRDGVAVVALLGEEPLGLVVESEAGQHLLVPHTAARVAVDDLDQVFDRVLAVPHDMTRYPFGNSDQLPVHHQHPVIVSPDEALDDHAAAVLLRHRERGANLRGIGQVDRDPAPVVGVVRLHHDRVADLGGGPNRIFFPSDERLLGYRQSQPSEDLVGLLLVGGQLDGDVRSAAGDRRLNSLLILAVSELDQTLRIEPDPGNPAFLGGVDQRGSAGSQIPSLSKLDEGLQLGLK